MSGAEDVIKRFEAGTGVLSYAVSGLTPEQVQAKPGPGAWSIAQVVAHLVDSESVYSDRMCWVIAEHEPVLQGFDENAWVERLGTETIPLEESLNLFAASRTRMSRILRHCQESDFARAGRHTERGPLTLAELLVSMTNHVDHHLRFVYGKRANLGAAVPPRYTAD